MRNYTDGYKPPAPKPPKPIAPTRPDGFGNQPTSHGE